MHVQSRVQCGCPVKIRMSMSLHSISLVHRESREQESRGYALYSVRNMEVNGC